MPVTLRDIGKALGLSLVTVSLTLRNSARIREKRRLQVLKMAPRLGYQPNPMATAEKFGYRLDEFCCDGRSLSLGRLHEILVEGSWGDGSMLPRRNRSWTCRRKRRLRRRGSRPTGKRDRA